MDFTGKMMKRFLRVPGNRAVSTYGSHAGCRAPRGSMTMNDLSCECIWSGRKFLFFGMMFA
jgi:hypothetical protein